MVKNSKGQVRIRILNDGGYFGFEKHRSYPVIVWATVITRRIVKVDAEELQAIGYKSARSMEWLAYAIGQDCEIVE